MRPEFSKDTGPTSPATAMSGIADVRISHPSTSSAVVSHASPIASPECGKAPMTAGISGENSPDLFASLSPDGCWLKTYRGSFQLNLDGTLDAFSETWPRSGTMLNGNAYRRQPWALPTDGSGSGSSRPREWYPTPIVSDAKGASTERFKGSPKCRGNLREVLRNGPTDGLYPHPRFVEWLMGFPTGFTDLPAWGMRSFRSSSKSSDRRS